MYRRSTKRLEPKMASLAYFSNGSQSATPVKQASKEKLIQTETKASQPNKSALTDFDVTAESQGEQGMMIKTAASAVSNPRAQKNSSTLGLTKSASASTQQQPH